MSLFDRLGKTATLNLPAGAEATLTLTLARPCHPSVVEHAEALKGVIELYQIRVGPLELPSLPHFASGEGRSFFGPIEPRRCEAGLSLSAGVRNKSDKEVTVQLVFHGAWLD